MNVFYCIGFDVNKSGGKSRATSQKIKSLSTHKGISSFLYFSPSNRVPLILSLVYLELKISVLLILKKPDVIICRGWLGFFPLLVAHFINVKYVREVHADLIEEVTVMDKSRFEKKLLSIAARYILSLELNSDVLIFNHPTLEEGYTKKYNFKNKSFYTYNGFGTDFNVSNNIKELKEKYAIPLNTKIICFTGSVSSWHGIEYVYKLSKEIEVIKANIIIVIAGGELPGRYTSKSIYNISPLDSQGCDEIIQLSDACILPVKNNRMSPGSPLKLYDYIKYQKFIFVQSNVKGYSDEVYKYSNGCQVDFKNAKETAKTIIQIFDNSNLCLKNKKVINDFSWEARMSIWIEKLKEII
tara:strand:- start:6030 stop:7094 length:1065 start_codon:yes stop_codon:yes gene_type:complete